jgi:hypothetical protein
LAEPLRLPRHIRLARPRTQMAWLIGFMVVNVFVAIGVAALAIAQASQVSRNVTTNELANWHRYKYLHVGLQGAGCRACQQPHTE